MSGPAQTPPEPGLDLGRFPATALDGSVVQYRAHAPQHDPDWYGSSMTGRFDLAAPAGTAYVADSPEAAYRERLRGLARHAIITPQDAARHAITPIRGVRRDRLAEISGDRRAARYDVHTELAAMPAEHYGISQAWAAAFHAAGFDGIGYIPRFTPGGRAAALFRARGGRHPIGARRGRTVTGIAAAELAGFRVVPPPTRRDRITILGR